MSASETVEVTGHLMDSSILSRILDDIRDYGGDYVIDKFDVGHDAHDPSSAMITIEAEDDQSLQRLLMRVWSRMSSRCSDSSSSATTVISACDGSSVSRPTSKRSME